MGKIKIGICDDEELWVEEIRKSLLKYSEIFQKEIEIKTFFSAEDYLKKEDNVDILLLDIEMDNLSGIDLKNVLAQKMKEEAIIFISSYDGFVRKAFGKNVYGFIDKPIPDQELYGKLNAIIEERENIVQIPVDNDSYISSPDIIYIKASNIYVDIFTNSRKHTGYFSLKECEQKLPPSCFRRVQKSYIINYQHILTIKNFIEMDNGFKIKVTRGMITKIRAEYMDYARKEARD